MDVDEEEFWTFSAQVMIAILFAIAMCVMWNALRQVRLFITAVPVRTLELGSQSELNLVDSIVIPTSVYCSSGGECCHTSRKCEGLQNVPVNAIKRKRLCVCCVQRDGR